MDRAAPRALHHLTQPLAKRQGSAAKATLPILPPEEGEIPKAAKSHSDEASSQRGAKHDDLLCKVLENPSAFVTCPSEMQRSPV